MEEARRKLAATVFDTEAAYVNLTKWISGDGDRKGKETEEELLCREEKAHPDRFYVRTEPKKTASSGVQPRLRDNQEKHYRWMHEQALADNMFTWANSDYEVNGTC